MCLSHGLRARRRANELPHPPAVGGPMRPRAIVGALRLAGTDRPLRCDAPAATDAMPTGDTL